MIAHLLERGLSYYRLNADDVGQSRITVRISDGHVERRLQFGTSAVDLERVSCVWYRRALHAQAPSSVSPQFQPFVNAELRHLYEGVIASANIRWVNPLIATELAERKLFQLRCAREVGLRVPATVVSDDVEALVELADAMPVICKPISQGLVRTGDGWFAVHTRQVRSSELRGATSATGVPALVQQLVPRGRDIRLTLIGDEHFPVEVVTSANAPIDWRASPEDLSYRVCEVPTDVLQACRALLSRLQLVYGAFDFIRTDDGVWYFLEVNPAGEWAWLEVELGLPMRQALAKLFYQS